MEMPIQSPTKPITYIAISDIHLGHRKTTSRHIARSLELFFSENEGVLSTASYLFIVGDLWDRLLEWPSDELTEAIGGVNIIVGFCQRHRIKLRVLEGTPFHDWHQSKHFNSLNKALNVRYYDKLTLDVEADGLSVLYVPDEWGGGPSQTEDEVREAMCKAGLSKVSLVMLHGHFEFQIPAHLKQIVRHNGDFYRSICQYYVHAGHDHRYAQEDGILAQGSFERLAHNEETDKGLIVATISPGHRTHQFLVNRHAKVYKTLTLKDKDLQSCVLKLGKYTHTYSVGSAFALIITHHDVRSQFKALVAPYPEFEFTLREQDKKPSQVATSTALLQKPSVQNTESLKQEVVKRAYAFSPHIEQTYYQQLISEVVK